MPESPRRPPLPLPLAVLVALPGASFGAATYLGLPHPDLAPPLAALIYGLAIIGAAFILAWAAEAAQVDISGGLALAVLALLAVLPEYAVDFVFSFRAGQVYEETGTCQPGPDGASPCSLALANMTGANRVLVGVGWPLVVLAATLAVLRSRRKGGDGSASTHVGCVQMPRKMAPEVVFLGLATLYSLTLPLRHTLTLVDAAVLVSIFVGYAWRLAQAPTDKPDLLGTAKWVGTMSRAPRRWTVSGMFVIAALVILAAAEHFAEGLVATGSELGVNPFILVQWVAPLASESPELIVACLYAWRLKAGDSLGTLLSSKVNQWTLLVGTIPIVFASAGSTTDGLPLDEQQRYELLLTAAQSLFAVSILVSLALTVRGAVALLVLFLVQFVSSLTLSAAADRVIVVALSVLYGLLAIVRLVRHRREFVQLTRDGLVAPFEELTKTGQRKAG
ncbi:sodium:proton exchanger [Pseudonocardia bannensis]|uniref:Sodium:proton exchanger n=1 Tax=Pseudonocardia bannensis TaxID=630973 RepID=A0A848DH98_9PSEU|nr:sodium:proton exchanger [Pseudonocardia bannensis]NMH91884.1 sodium:proton exchanger [Pseudonocardia bannensis]